jgi:hypothetical protein
MDENVKPAQGAEEAGTRTQRGFAGVVRADGDATVQQAVSLVTTARGDATVQQAASVVIVSGGDTSVKMAAAVAMPTLGDVHIDKGVAQWLISAGDVTIEKGGCAAAVAPSVKVERGFLGVALGRHVDVGEGGRVLFGPLAAAVFGIAAGVGVGVILAASAGYAATRAVKRIPQLPWRS